VKRTLCILALTACLVACGGGQDDPLQTGNAASTSAQSNVTYSSVPIGPGPWDVSYTDMENFRNTCYPTADYVTVTNVQPNGRSYLFLLGRYLGDASELVAALPACPAPI
jgi:hypothetical protein